jgi:hypothetical protein
MQYEGTMAAPPHRRPDVVQPLALVAATLAAAVVVIHAGGLSSFVDAHASAIRRRGEHVADYGLTLEGWQGELAAAAIAALVLFPPFLLGFRIWWQPPGGFDWDLPWPVWQLAATHLFVVAVPEELLYRGFVQQRLGRVFTGRVRVLGVQVGWAVVVTSALFAAGHFLTDLRVDRLATFFPGLVFGWLKERRGRLVGPVVLHAASNVFSDILSAGYFG